MGTCDLFHLDFSSLQPNHVGFVFFLSATLPEKPVKLAPRARKDTGIAQTLPPARAGKKSFREDDAFSTMAGLAEADAEVSDISEADPQALLQAMKDLDDMDADLLGLRKSHLASSKNAAKGSGREELPSNPKPAGTFTANEKGPSIPLAPGDTPIRKKDESLFDDGDDIMAALGFGDSPKADRRQTGDQEGPRPARSKLDELLGRGTATKLLARPGTGEHSEFKLDRKYQRPQDKDDTWGDEDFTFGAYQPTMGSSEGRQSRRQPVRFLAEGTTDLKGEAGSKQSTPVASSPTHPRKGGADWLGLKEDDWDLHPPSATREPHRGGSAFSTPSAPHLVGRHSAPAGLPSSSGAKPAPKDVDALAKASQASQLGAPEGEEEEDWLSHALSRKKSQGPAREEHTAPSKGQNAVGVSLLPESLARSLLPGTEYQKQLLAAQVQLQSGTAELQAELLQSQARLADLEAQVRKLELERAQHKLLLESLQQRHQADLELIENAHSQCSSQRQAAEQARAELTAQHQRRLAAAMQEKDQEVERLRELQRASILDMRKEHEEQLQRLKLLKDREIDAVTSATSHTRSLNGIIEQMEKFSSSLNELSSRVEASHLNTAQEWELGVRQRDEQLRALQERLGRQQRDMEEERSRLQEVIVKMEARLSEQSRLLEQERWRVSAEQSKAESTQRALEEQRRVVARQTAVEREELERAKSALLEEQKAVMHKCGEEQRRLAAEWAEFFAQQKLSKERAEREAERALQVDAKREGTLVSLAKEQAELKIRASELRGKEDQLAAEREALERERQELRLEQERVSAAALRIRLRAEEVERMSQVTSPQVASEKYEEGERALREAQQVQSAQQARLQLRALSGDGAQEHLSLAQQRLQLDRVRQDLSSGPVGLLTRAQGLATSGLSAIVAPALADPRCSQPPASLGPSHLHAKLVLLKHTAEQDRDFLENEQFFLETLKNASYNVTSHSA
ncbi:Fas-binding factor 1 [Pteropus alecto]|uniref:Fas-binding factor 1 n=1 Tax=Pteropus alecto TaxID=9402 RepID=L5KNZ0_PTEAL|nr:Fas-binding factor 1 [Pteropus alecto]